MAATYKQFLAAPSSSLLADTAALHYITTTTTFSGPTEIIKHLNALQKQVAKKKEEVFNIVDGQNVIVLEVDTGLGFQTGGGPYLPGLDDNFLSARDVYLPITHFVTFDEAGKILQIRLQWDQGSLLKQVEVIGKSGRNWPIRDSREQIAFIQSCIRTAGTGAPVAPSHNETVARNRTNSTNALRDPHASLRLFGPRDEIEAEPASVVSPYAGTSRPRQRSFTEILGDEPTSPSSGRRNMSPSKRGQGKNFQPSRIFDGQEHVEQPEEQPQPKNKRYIRPNPKKFSHFDFADGSDPQDAPQPGQSFDERPKSKHDSQWSFQDFVTPQKVKPSRTMRTQDVRHWDTDKDVVDETPGHPAAKPRRDADAHFELLDDGNITNVKDRGKDFDHHFDISDESPAAQKENRPIENTDSHKINIAGDGDGMGGKKGTERDWLYNETSETAATKSIPTRTPGSSTAPTNEVRENTDKHKINIAGDGMGGRKGTNRDWLYGELDEQPLPTRQNASSKKDFWDF
ncbi:hypothetical protein FOC1_g10015728 [Fusarium oxysporum f. sp. cubense race 1]|uniref:Uncharacterized protein n=1 Tax=Fusarium oxysporum f. sp. cubense (strain race 1) TaxID=1229664 RepID=N4TP28_FUSC1|nr:hypothetical protein FOC1_g10015728 [Fusarium oxysporum f. sp. cubense race 1]